MKESFEIKENTSFINSYKLGIYFVSKNKKYRRIYYFILIAGSVLSLLSLLSPKVNWIETIATLVMGVLAPLVFIAAGMFVLMALLYLVKPDLFKVIFLFNHWGMNRKTKAAEYSKPWSAFVKWKETKHFFLLFITEYEVHTITKKNMEEADLPDFRQLLGDRIGLF